MKYTYEKCCKLINKPPGYKLDIDYEKKSNERWIKMADSEPHHIEGMYLNIDTGVWKHASHLFMMRKDK